MNSKTAFLLLTVFIVGGCETFDSQEDNSFTILPHEVSVTDKQSGSVTFNVLNTCASGCWYNIQDKVQRDSNTYKIRILAENEGRICPTVCIELEREIKIEVPGSGTYDFQFIHRDSTYQKLELSFP